jgi:hypothetical protein
MEKKKIYISGKISNLLESEAQLLFENAEKVCIEMGYEPVNPMKLNHNHDKSWEAYMKEDIVAMMSCSAIYMLNNWESSNGAKVERELAIKLGFEVIYQQ